MGVVGVVGWIGLQVGGCCRCDGSDWDSRRWVL